MLALVPTALRQQVNHWAKGWLAEKFGRLLRLRAQDPGPFNYPVEIYSEWRGKAFYICTRFRTQSRRPEDDFVVRHTRMTMGIRSVRPGLLPPHRAVVHRLPRADRCRVYQ